MGSDLFTLKALAFELNTKLNGARVDKIQQPEKDEIRIFVRTKGKNHCLCISCNAGAPRIHITNSKKASPITAPSFCMILRKYLSSSNIENIKIYNNDRIMQIKFNARTEMQDNAVYYLYFEIMNRYSNIVFTDNSNNILGAVKYLSLDSNRDHIVLRGIKYEAVSQPKISFLDDCFEVVDKFENGDIHKYLQNNISGFSGLTISELLNQCYIPTYCENLSKTNKDTLKNKIIEFRNIQNSEIYQPCIIANKDIYTFPYKILDGEIENFDSLSDAYDNLFTKCDQEIRNKARLKNIKAIVKRLKAKTEKNISYDIQRLDECKHMDEYRIFGELIVSNIYKIKKGDKILNCLNYYNNEEISITLDEKLSPSKNSARYFNKYNKLKRQKVFVDKKIVEDKILLEYIHSIEAEIEDITYDKPIYSIENELIKLGAMRKKSKTKIRKEKHEPPYTYKFKGFTILKGKNNIQNDELTFKIANGNDVWMHMKNEHGTHTIILAKGNTIPDEVLKVASEIASSQKNGKIEVDYTQRKFVKRQPNGHCGQVIYTNYKTIVAQPNSHEELLVKG